MTDDTIETDRELVNDGRDGKPERLQDREIREVRASDIEPYTGLRYLSKLFRFMAIIMVLLLVAEVVTGMYTQGSASLPTLLGEASRLIVLAGVLWGTGDLALLLVDMGHDVRAGRILIARIAHAANVPPLVPSRASVEVSRARPTDVAVVPPPRSLADRADSDSEGPPIP
jgi:hypothetical protein